MYKKAWCTPKIVVLLIKPIVFVAFPFPSPKSDLKVPNIAKNTSTVPWPLCSSCSARLIARLIAAPKPCIVTSCSLLKMKKKIIKYHIKKVRTNLICSYFRDDHDGHKKHYRALRWPSISFLLFWHGFFGESIARPEIFLSFVGSYREFWVLIFAPFDHPCHLKSRVLPGLLPASSKLGIWSDFVASRNIFFKVKLV